MPQDTTLYREITLDLQHHNFPDVLAVENDNLRGWLITPLNNGALMDVTGFTPSLWSIATTQEIPQPSTGEVTADGKLAIPIPAGMLVPGTRTVQQVKLSKAGVGDIRFPAFSLIVGDALDNLGGSAGGDTGVWQELMDRIQAATALTEQLRNEAAVSAAQADEDRTAAEQAAVQAQTCQEQACQCAANAEASKTAAANSESAALASRNAAASSASAAAGSASNALASANAANASAVAAQLSESNVEAIEQSLQDTVTQAEEATAAANQAVQGVQNILSGALATQSSDGLMSQEDKEKLDGIEPGANNYTHPASHPISMIEELQEALDAKQNETDLSLITKAKTITGAINELATNTSLQEPITFTPENGITVLRNTSHIQGGRIYIDLHVKKSSAFPQGQTLLGVLHYSHSVVHSLSACVFATGGASGATGLWWRSGGVYIYNQSTSSLHNEAVVNGIIVI